ncbi:MAG: hypothetical protein IPI46_07105 [Bacteroidetes bacterium]|nr:hypothetical protein [Bacteroidota bacterium]
MKRKLNPKKLVALGFMALMSGFYMAPDAKAQVPQKFNYQGIARDSKGNPLSKQQLAVKLTVLPTEDATMAEYEETQLISTNEFGLYTLQIGNGTPVLGEMKTVKWETGNKYIRVAIDPTGGSNYVDAGTTQLLSVPYAIYADKAGIARETVGGEHGGTRSGNVSTSAAGTGTINFLTKFTAANTIYNSQIFDNGTNVGLGTITPSAKFHVFNNAAVVQEHLRMQNASATGAGRFTMYNDLSGSYATFTKYGTTFAGGYPGVTTLYPYANLLAFGNNGIASGDGLGRFLISSGGNVGISIFKSGVSKLKFHADFTTENVGIGGNSTPVARVHMNNTDGTTMSMLLSNNTTGHTANDGLDIRNTGNVASITNRENSSLSFGTNNTQRATILADGNVGINTATPMAKLEINAVNDSALVSNSTISEDSTTGNYLSTGSVTGGSSLTYGVIGQVTNGDYGAGVFGRGFGSSPLPFNNRDVGLYGSANWLNQAIGVLGTSNDGTALMGLSNTGMGAYLKSTSGNALVADTGNVIVNTGRLGIGTVSPISTLDVENTGDNRPDSASATFFNNGAIYDGNAISAISNDGVSGGGTIWSKALIGGGQATPNTSFENFGVWGHATGNGSGGYGGIFSSGSSMSGSTKFVSLGGDALRPLAAFMGGNIGVGTTTPASTFELLSSNSTNYSMHLNDLAGSKPFGSSMLRIDEAYDGFAIDVNKTGIFEAVNMNKNNTFSGTPTLQVTGNMALGTPSLRVSADSNLKAAQFDGYVQINDGTEGNGKVLTSDASGNASWKANQTGGNFSGGTNTPSSTFAFLSPTSATATITSSTQKVMWTATVSLGSVSVGGATDLDIYPAYQETFGTIISLGGGIFDLRCLQNTRQTYTITGFVTGLTPGTYTFGMAGSSSSLNWNNNEYSYVTILVME